MNLSLAGRVELARSVLQGVECYWLQVLPLPSAIVDRINGLVRRFVWGSASSPVAWKTICKPKEEGGLALRNLSSWNKALLVKTLWNIHSKADSLWIQWIHSEYIKGRDVWSVVPKRGDSPLIKNILAIRDRIIVDCGSCSEAAEQLIDGWFKDKGTTAAYNHIRAKGSCLFWHKAIWKPFIPTRCSMTLWLALKGRLKMLDRLRHLNISRVCNLCNIHNESNAHLFFACGASKAFWGNITLWLRCKWNITTIPSAIKHLNRERAGSAIVQAKLIALAFTVNAIWRARNQLVFEDTPFDVKDIVFNIKWDVYTCLYSLFPVEQVMAHMDANSVAT